MFFIAFCKTKDVIYFARATFLKTSEKEFIMGYYTEQQYQEKYGLQPQQNDCQKVSVLETCTELPFLPVVKEEQKPTTSQTKKAVSSKSAQNANFVQLLTHIYNAGWLTPHVIALLMRPEINSKLKFAQKLLRNAKAKGYVTPHALPKGKSFAFCLTDRGASFLRQNNIDAGRSYCLRQENGYQVPGDWEHHIFAVSALALLKKEKANSKIIFERQIRLQFPNLEKIPDGLLIQENKKALWLEVERREKKDAERDKILQLVTEAYYQKLNLLPDIKEYRVVIVYDPNQKKPNGQAINHHDIYLNDFNINNRRCEIEFSFGKLEFFNGSVESIKLKDIAIFSKEVEKMAADLHYSKDWIEHHPNAKLPGSFGLYFETWCAEFKRINDHCFLWFCGNNVDTRSGKVDDFEDALKYISSSMLMLGLSFDEPAVKVEDSLDEWVRE